MVLFLGLGALGLSTFGFALAWWLDSSQAYHAIMMVLLLPGWILSGAMFPINPEQTTMAWVMQLNPMSYIVDGVRRAFYNIAPSGTMVADSLIVDFGVVF